ncbi:MAG: PEGA domain-containing protein [Candidatus Nomurabacteria bacterium]|jgi:hypothetical protein|nr:PEGA domain-containing protein [Candidatus Nomurabacteria bacterium]
MEQARKKKLRSARVIATNLFMGLSVIVIVSVLTLIAMGYSFNKEWGLEQSGLVQIGSRPRGAIVEIDDDAQMSRTEMSKLLSSGEHTIRISKPGYDVWERVLNVESGLLTRVDWARLFPIEKIIENVHEFESLRLVSVSPDNQYMLLLPEDTTKIQMINIKNDDVKYSTLDLQTVLGLEKNAIPGGELEIIEWNKNSDKFLLKWTIEKKENWILVDTKKASSSINLSAKFLLNFDKLMIASDSADKVWALESGNLRLISTSESTISGVLVGNIESVVANNANTVAYVQDSEELGRIVGVFKEGEQGGATIQKVNEEIETVKVALGSYWGDDWIAYSLDDRIYVRSGSYPSYGKSASSMKIVAEHDIDFVPEFIKASPSGRFVVAANKQQVVTVDVELKEHWIYEVNTELDTVNWLDNFMTWEIWDDKLVVRDFDGNNRREIAEAASGQGVALTENDRWLYIVDYKDDGFILKRERL